MPQINSKLKCLTCDNPPAWKGLCQRCYKVAKRLVDNRKTTWEQLANNGLADIDELADNPFMKRFRELELE